jgi:hypothetical protein
MSDLHVNKPLTNISVAYVQSTANFVAPQVFPNIGVQHQSDQYWKYKKGDFFRNDVEPRAPGTPSAGTGYEVELDAYYTPVYALHQDIPDQVRANADSVFDLDRDATANLTHQFLIHRDQLWASRYFKTGVWGTDYTGVTSAPNSTQVLQWDQADADPVEWVDLQKVKMMAATGRSPNVLVMGPEVMVVLKHSSSILERIKYTQRGVLTEELLASMFGVERVIVASAIAATTTYEPTVFSAPATNFIFGKSLLLTYSTATPSVMTPTAGYTFSWTGYLGAGAAGQRIKKFRMEELASDRIEMEAAYEFKVVSPDMGIFASGIVA